MSKSKNNGDDDDIDEESLRQRIEASERDRIKRNEIRAQRKKDRKSRVEKIIDRPLALTGDDKLEIHKKNILAELEKREKILESKMKSMEKKIVGNNELKNKEMEDKIVNNFINKLAVDHYNKLDEKLKKLATTLNNKIDGLANKNQNIETTETKKIKTMFLAVQNQMKSFEEILNRQEQSKELELKEQRELLQKNEGKAYEQLQDQIMFL